MLGTNLINQVKQEEKKRFVKWLNEGHSLTFAEIKACKPYLKTEYVKHLQEESEKMKVFVQSKIEEIQKRNNEMAGMQLEMNESRDEFQTELNHLNDVIKKAAEGLGLDNVLEFQTFKVQDSID